MTGIRTWIGRFLVGKGTGHVSVSSITRKLTYIYYFLPFLCTVRALVYVYTQCDEGINRD